MPDVLPVPEAPVPAERIVAPERSAASEISSVEADESARERLPETQDNILHVQKKNDLDAAREDAIAPSTAGGPVTVGKDEVTIEVERVLEEGMGAFFASLPEDAKPLFKQKGEEAAREISSMVQQLRVQARRVLQLIYIWLKTIPGVNKFFLEQEAKIKTDRIMALAEERRRAIDSQR